MQPNKQRHAHSLIQQHPENIVILFECEHDSQKKERHHPNYDKPYEVEMLCRSCHRKKAGTAINKGEWDYTSISSGKVRSIQDAAIKGLGVVIEDLEAKS